MKIKLVILSLVLLIINTSSFAQTTVPGGNVSGTWTLAGSPYNVTGHITVPASYTLTIQPGVNVVFQGHYKFNIQGTILAVGTATDTIVFTAANTGTGWWGMRFNSTPSTQDSSIFKYCKVQWGKASGTGNDLYGGGFLFNNFSKANVSNSKIAYNMAESGGGISCLTSSPVINANLICNDTATWNYGGGIYCDNSSPKITGNIIRHNSAKSSGGGIFCNWCPSPLIRNNIISNNSALANGGEGGGIYCLVSPAEIINNAICNNTSLYSGGGIFCNGSSPKIINTIIINNYANGNGASNGGGGIYCNGASNPIIKNSIIWGNSSFNGLGNQVFLNDDPSDPSFNYCDVQGTDAAFETNGNTYSGSYTNNINSDPLFVSPSGGAGTGFNGVTANWSLQSSSPCKDAGTPNTVGLNLPAKDLANNPRITPCIVDMGAYEYQYGTPFLISISQTATIPCNGYTTGALLVTASGGTPAYTYLWSNNGTTTAISNLGANTYSVSVNDASACVRTATFTITQPAGMTVNTSQTNIDCSGNCIGSATVSVSGGTIPYTYAWSSGETTSATNTNLCSGPYSVVVTDAGGCSKTASVTITTPSSLGFTTTQVNVSCKNGNNGSITVNASGGTPNYQYSKDGGTNYQASNNFTGLTANSYSMVVKDNAGCQTSATAVPISEPNVLAVSVSHTDVVCYGGSEGTATANVTGGTNPYTYLWNTVPAKTTQAVTNLSVGNYTITITDAKGCAATNSVSVSSTLPVISICLVSVDSTSTKNRIVWEKPVTLGIDSFIIYRKGAVFNRIGAQPYSALTIFTDSSAGINPKVQAYEYAISALDTCGNPSPLSPSHITIHQATPQFTPPATYDLSWTDYSGYSFTYYFILRDNNNTGNWIKIDSVPYSLQNQYTDLGVNHPLPTDSSRYVIESFPLSPCIASLKYPDPMTTTVKSSKSNGSEKIIGPTSAAENKKELSFVIYPSPNSGTFTVASSTHAIESIRIFNPLGEQVYHKNVNAKKTDVSLPEIAKGVYHLQITSEGSVINKKIVIR